MAVNAGTTAGLAAGERRLVYGLNVLLTVVLAVCAVALAVWAAGRFGGRADMSSSGINSLSPRTVNLLRGLGEDVKITAVYSTALKEVRKFDEARRNRVSDLLDLYEGAGRGRITAKMLDPRKDEPRVRTLFQSLLEKPAYREQIAPHQEALAAFEPLSQQIVQVVQQEKAELERLMRDDPAFGRVNQVASIRFGFDQLLDDAASTAAKVKQLQESDLPQYGDATESARAYLAAVQNLLDQIVAWTASSAPSLAVSPDAKAFLLQRQDAYKPVLEPVKDVLAKLTALQPPKLEELSDKLARGQAIVVETPGGAEVLSFDDVFPMPTDGRTVPENVDPREFAGEQTVSSAILKLTQKERTAVVFVRAGGEPLLKPDFTNFNPMMRQQMPEAPFQGMNELLEQQNFITAEWDVQTDPNAPLVEGAARTIYVVFPPAPPRQNPMQPMPPPGLTDEQKLAVEGAIDRSGKAIFMAGWSVPPSGRYAFEDYLRSTWQIGVRSEHLVVEYVPHLDKPGRWMPARREIPIITSDLFRFSGHPIGKPLQSQAGALYMVCPLENLAAAASQPTGVEVMPVVEVPATEGAWASGDFMQVFQTELRTGEGTTPKPDDVRPPFPIALAATRGDKQLVVFGSERFASDDIALARQYALTGAGLVAFTVYPANSDLFINALHWLAGEADRIAVGARSSELPRLDRLKPGGTATFWRIFLVGIWPAVILLIGGGVWLMRRR